MIRNLKLLGLAALALVALSAVAVSSAQAATFHKPAETIKLKVTPDGTTTTAHQVFDAAMASITCTNVDGSAEVVGTATTFSEVTTSSIEYTVSGSTCKFVGQTATVNMHGCNYAFAAAAEGVSARVEIKCSGTNEIEFSVPSPTCVIKVPGAQDLSGITYHNINTKSEITVEAHVENIHYTASGTGCPTVGTFDDGTYTTGNFIVTAENLAGTMKPVFIE